MPDEKTGLLAQLLELFGRWLEQFLTFVNQGLWRAGEHFTSPDDRLFILYLLIALPIFWYAFIKRKTSSKVVAEKVGDKNTFKNFLGFAFPKEIYMHPSAILDYKLFVINSLLMPFVFVLVVFNSTLMTAATYDAWFYLFGEFNSKGEWNIYNIVPYGGLVIIGSDFGYFLWHYVSHKISIFWSIHSVHHSAEVMTPLTYKRAHPFEILSQHPIMGFFIGMVQGTGLYFFIGDPDVSDLAKTNYLLAGIFGLWVLFFLVIANFRHSHIWITYNNFFSHLLLSPAQHQIHHSQHPQHIDKNFGQIFGLWDWMFGTLYVPKEEEKLTLGIAGIEQPHSTVVKAYSHPLLEIYQENIKPLLNREARKPLDQTES